MLERGGILFCLVGPSGSGKSTLAARLLADNKQSMRLSISATSRPARDGEKDGEDYHFLSLEHFRQAEARGEFFETEQIHGNFYGTYLQAVNDAIRGGTDLLLDIDIKGALNFKKSFRANAVICFIAPSTPNELKKRIAARSLTTEREVARRMQTAVSEYAVLGASTRNSDAVDYLIINDVLDEAFADLSAVLRCERLRLSRLAGTALESVCKID